MGRTPPTYTMLILSHPAPFSPPKTLDRLPRLEYGS